MIIRNPRHSVRKTPEKPSGFRAEQLMEEHMRGKRLDTTHIPLINRALTHDASNVRARGIDALMKVTDPQKSEKLVWMLEDPDWFVKVKASEALGTMKEKAALPALIGLLKNTNCYVRSAAADALGEIGSGKAIPALERIAILGERPELNAEKKEKGFVIRSARLALKKLDAPEYHCMMGMTAEDRAEMIEFGHGP